jgi:putative CocE/NonD family hydrolase
MQSPIIIDKDVDIESSDATVLRADIYHPDDGKKYPAILARSPYGKDFDACSYMNPQRIARAGYVVVIQDCRGTGASDGEYYPHLTEAKDGYDTVEWLARQPWCDGNVGMYGNSYLGFTQWAAASTQPPHLKAICPAQYLATIRGAPFFTGGIHQLFALLNWGLLMDERIASKNFSHNEKPINIERQYDFLPWKDNPAARTIRSPGIASFFYRNLTRGLDDSYWDELCSPAPVHKVIVPGLHVSSWYDLTPDGVIDNYLEMRKKGGSQLARDNQKLIIGPWGHGALMSNIAGELDFGPASTGDAIDLTGIHIRWFDYWLKGKDNGIMDEPPVKIFVMGDNIWKTENEWPLERTNYTSYYFHSNGHANSMFGDGVLNIETPGPEKADSYVYDPDNPVPSLDRHGNPPSGAHDQRQIEERKDVLVYTSKPLESDMEITGPIEIILYASSSALDTDFTGKLADVWPDGRAYNLVDGIIRARFRESDVKPKLLRPHKIYKYRLNLRATSNVFKANHRIRVEISSSKFPHYDRNLNTGRPIGQDAMMKSAIQTIYHDDQYPSHIVLPVIPG